MPNRTDRWLGAYAELLVRGRWLILLLSVLAVVLAGAGASRLALKNDHKMWFSPDDPELLAFEALQNTYTKNENILFVLTPRGGDVFTPKTLAAIEELTTRSWQLPYALRVDSITNFQHAYAVGDDLIVEDLVRDAPSLSADALAIKREIALNEPALVQRLINKGGSVTGVNVTLQFPLLSQEEIPAAVTAARALAKEIQALYPQLEIRLTGSTMLNHAFAEASLQDMGSLVPAMYLIILVVMVVMLRSALATLATTLVIVFSIVTALGIAGWLGLPVTPPMASTPTIIMTLAVADSVHVFVTFFEGLRQGLTKPEALKRSLVHNGYPMFLTSLTTAIGFLTMDAAEAPPFRDLGYVVAIGVAAAWLYSMTFLPALISVLPINKAPKPGRATTLGMAGLGEWVIARRKGLLTGALLVTVFLLAMIPRNELNDEFVKYFDESIEFRRDTDYAMAHLTGVNQLQFSLPAGGENAVADPAFLAKLDAFTAWLRSQPEVVHVASLADTFKRLNMNMHGDDPAAYTLPKERALAAQYLLLYELSLPYGLDLNNQLNVDKSATQVVVTLATVSSATIREFAARAESWLKAETGIIARGSGTPVMYAHISERNIKSMLKGTVTGLALISLLLVLALKSVRIGLISLIPNLLPAGLAFGLWGLLVGQVNLAVSVVAGVTFGIVVDDTIHFLSKYLRARREHHLSPEDAIRHSFRHAGPALLTTTVILVAGFAVLACSSFGINASMAQLTAVAILIAMLGDFLLLPALLLLADRKPATLAAKEAAHAPAH